VTRGAAFVARLAQMVDLAAALPPGASVTIEWTDAPPDLLLALAQQDGGELRERDGMEEAEWISGSLTIRAQRAVAPATPRPTLKLVKP
jgi:hypothetical protein